MRELLFKKGDRVYHWDYGWGEITYIENLLCSFRMQVSFSRDTLIFTELESARKVLSFTSYNFVNGGFSKVPPKPDIKKTQLIYVSNGNASYNEWYMMYFSHWEGRKPWCFMNQKKEGKTQSWAKYSLYNPLEQK